jgi:toxin ParE1/3/4
LKPTILRERARRDIEEAAAWYLREAGERTALRFADAVQVALRSISRRPAAGSPRWAVDLDLPGLRSLNLGRFPYFVFYVEREREVDIWRVLHGHRDVPSLISPVPGRE